MVALTAHPDPTPSAPAEPFPRAHLFDLLLDPTKSLQDVAASLNTTLDHLSLFLASDQGEALLSQAHHLTTLRTRALATAHLHKAIAALGTMLDDYNRNHNATPNTPSTANPDTLLHHKHHDQARRAAHLLLRLAHFNPRGTGVPPVNRGMGVPAHASAQGTHNHRSPSPALPTRAQLPATPPRPTLHPTHPQPTTHAQSPPLPTAHSPLPLLPPRPSAPTPLPPRSAHLPGTQHPAPSTTSTSPASALLARVGAPPQTHHPP